MRLVIIILLALWISLTPTILWLFWVTFNTYQHLQNELDRLPACVVDENGYNYGPPPHDAHQDWIDEHAPLITDEEIEALRNQ